MAQAARQALTPAPRYNKPANFAGTDVAWRALCDCYPSAETAEILVAVMEYCAVRRLDPFKRPVHIVPMWNSKLGRRVQVVMQGINEIEITAARTGEWVGMDEADYGPEETREFRGTVEDERRGEKREMVVKLTYPVSAAVKVYRLVKGQRVPFSERVFFNECYGRAGFRTEVPNARWQLAPRQMLGKCAKAAALRAAFPEEGFGYTKEEMEDRETDAGGIVIDGSVSTSAPTQEEIEVEQQSELSKALGNDNGPGRLKLEMLDEPNGTQWLKHYEGLLNAATTSQEVQEVVGHPSVAKRRADAPQLFRDMIDAAGAKAFARMQPAADEAPSQEPPWETDPMQDLLEEIEMMDAISLAGLATNAQWRARVREAAQIPTDEDRINEAIEARRIALKGKQR